MSRTASLRISLALMCVQFALAVLCLEDADLLLGIINIAFAIYHGRCIDEYSRSNKE